MLHIAVGSKNPAKLAAVRAAFQKIGYEVAVTGLSVPSGVADQPFSDEETIRGALNRAALALGSGDYDFGIGLEGGTCETPYGMFLCNWGAIVDRNGERSIGGGIRILLPEQIAVEVRSGKELGTVIDEYTGGHDIAKKEGTIGVLTKGNINRSEVFRDVVICAFARFLK
jgi:inosine/xanthosine triphosphatase